MTNKQYAALLLIEAAHILKDIDEDQTTLEEGAVKSSKKHKLDNYLAKYNYKGDSKSGIITVDGKEYEIDRDTKSPIMKMPSGDYDIRETTAHTSTPNKIALGHEFEKLKNNKRRDAMLQHEIAHHKNHNLANGTITNDHKNAVIDAISKNMHNNFNISINDAKESLNKYNIPSKKESEYSDIDKQKVSNLEKFKKYETNKPHNDRVEYEADSYSSVHNNGEHLKRALRESNKYNKSEKEIKRKLKAGEKISGNKLNISSEQLKSIIKNQRSISDNDYKQRSKALKDKNINKNVYNKKD